MAWFGKPSQSLSTKQQNHGGISKCFVVEGGNKINIDDIAFDALYALHALHALHL
jgi:hypothetical protein